MADFRVPPIPKIRIAFIGVGSRGSAAVHRVPKIPGCEATVLCDVREVAVNANQKWLVKNGYPKAKLYFGKKDSWKAACDDPDVNVVYIATPAWLHTPISIYAMNAGKHVFTEVPGSWRIDDLWNYVETSEKTRRHCMMLENVIYRDTCLLVDNLCHQGVLGTLTHADGAYIHNLTEMHLGDTYRNAAKNPATLKSKGYRRGNTYPTHPLGPICRYFDINHGDRLEKLVSLSCGISSWGEYIDAKFGPDSWQARMPIDKGDMNTSIIRTARGRTIMLQIDMSTPRPNTRINLVQGSKGCFKDFPPRLSLCDKYPAHGGKEWLDEKAFAAIRAKYEHPLYRTLGAFAAKVGGHGGIDFLMDLRWAYCLQNGLPLDMGVYDLAAWSSVVECSRRSDEGGGVPVELPDFTRGAWKASKPRAIGNVDVVKMGLDIGRDVKKDNAQLEV